MSISELNSDVFISNEIVLTFERTSAQSNSHKNFLFFGQVKLLGSERQTSGTYEKKCRLGNKSRQRRGLLVFSELTSLPSVGSRSGCFHTSLGCKPISLIIISLG
jgi:hypothetical protein